MLSLEIDCTSLNLLAFAMAKIQLVSSLSSEGCAFVIAIVGSRSPLYRLVRGTITSTSLSIDVELISSDIVLVCACTGVTDSG